MTSNLSITNEALKLEAGIPKTRDGETEGACARERVCLWAGGRACLKRLMPFSPFSPDSFSSPNADAPEAPAPAPAAARPMAPLPEFPYNSTIPSILSTGKEGGGGARLLEAADAFEPL